MIVGLGSRPPRYGGFNSGEWDGSANVSGVLSIVIGAHGADGPTVTFDDTTVILTVDFGGTASSFIVDPTDGVTTSTDD